MGLSGEDREANNVERDPNWRQLQVDFKKQACERRRNIALSSVQCFSVLLTYKGSHSNLELI